mgnify:CR=1 FL=1|jgi:hypothetical protein
MQMTKSATTQLRYTQTNINFSYTQNNKTQVATVTVNYVFDTLTQKQKDYLLMQLSKKYDNVHINSYTHEA